MKNIVILILTCLLIIFNFQRRYAESNEPNNSYVSSTTGTFSQWISAIDTEQVKRFGQWTETSFRYAENKHLITTETGAALECDFYGTGIVLRMDINAVPAYGTPNLGKIVVTVDEGKPQIYYPRSSPNEITITRELDNRRHRLRLEHHSNGEQSGCRILGFRVLKKNSGDLKFVINGEKNAYLVDARAVLKKNGKVMRNTLVRNRLTGQCCLGGLPPGDDYSLELNASGWKPVLLEKITVPAGSENILPPIYLYRDESTKNRWITYPALNRQAIHKPGETFRSQIIFSPFANGAELIGIILRRNVVPASISRIPMFQEDSSAAYYYNREVTVTLPDDMPAGLYDLVFKVSYRGNFSELNSPRSVYVVKKYPENPVFLTFGHLDTGAQYQAEYLLRLANIANLIAPDMVLNSNAVNPAYISGALSILDMPYVITFGNHQFPGHEDWYGEVVNLIDYGPELCILNFGLPWRVNLSKAHSLLNSRVNIRCKIINTYENNAPVETFLDRYKVNLLHDAHGTGKRVDEIGSTPTVRVGKVNAVSFRVVRFKDNKVISCTYKGDEVAPIPFGREEVSPLRVKFTPDNDGTNSTVKAVVTNDWEENFPKCRVVFLLPNGKYKTDRGYIESEIVSDDNKYLVLSTRIDIPALSKVFITVTPE